MIVGRGYFGYGIDRNYSMRKGVYVLKTRVGLILKEGLFLQVK